MKRILFIISTILCIFLTACGDATSIGIIGGADGPTSIIVAEKGEKAMYEQITAEEAKKIMDSGEEYIVLDTREQDEILVLGDTRRGIAILPKAKQQDAIKQGFPEIEE